MPLSKSHGVFTSPTAVRSVSQSDLQKLYWQTTTQQHFQGRPLTEADQNECMNQVHLIGHHNTKYMRLPEKQSPALGRESCTYNALFAPMPTGEAAENRAFAEGLKSVCRMPSAPNLGGKTAYAEAFGRGRTQQELREASFQPMWHRQQPTAIFGELRGKVTYEQVSHTQRLHRELPMAAVPPNVRQRPHMTLAGGCPREFWSTQYQRDSLACTTGAWPAGLGSPADASKALDFEWAPPVHHARLHLALPPNIEGGA